MWSFSLKRIYSRATAGAPAVCELSATRPCSARMGHDLPDSDLPDSLFGEEAEDDDLGLWKMPLLQTPAQAGFHRFRERRRGAQPVAPVDGFDDDPIGRCVLGNPDPAAGTRGGNDLGFSLRETIFDQGDDAFGI